MAVNAFLAPDSLETVAIAFAEAAIVLDIAPCLETAETADANTAIVLLIVVAPLLETPVT
jgi:hypothetical protein